jgi:hypothetical protein
MVGFDENMQGDLPERFTFSETARRLMAWEVQARRSVDRTSPSNADITSATYFLEHYLIYSANGGEFEVGADHINSGSNFYGGIPVFFPYNYNWSANCSFPDDEKVLEVLSQTVDEIRAKIRDVSARSAPIQETFELIRQLKAAALNQGRIKQNLITRVPSIEEGSRIGDQAFYGLTRSGDRSLGRPQHPDYNQAYGAAESRAGRLAQADAILDRDEDISRDLRIILQESRQNSFNNLRSTFIEMLEHGEKFEYLYTPANPNTSNTQDGIVYHLSKDDVSRLSFQINPKESSQVLTFLDGKPIEFKSDMRGNDGKINFNLLQYHFNNSLVLRNRFLTDSEGYLEFAARLKVFGDFHHYINNLESLDLKGLSVSTFVEGRDWKDQFNPDILLVDNIHTISLRSLHTWVMYDMILNPRPNITSALKRLFEAKLKPKTEIDTHEQSARQGGDNPFIDNLFSRLHNLGLIPDSVSTDAGSLDNFNSPESYEDGVSNVHYSVVGEPQVLSQIARLSSLPTGEIEGACIPYTRAVMDRIPSSDQIFRLGSEAQVIPNKFMDTDQFAIRLTSVEFAKLQGFLLLDGEGNPISQEDYSILWNEYTGHYVCLFRKGFDVQGGYRYSADMLLPVDPKKEMVINREDINIYEIRKYLEEIGWEAGSEALREIASSGEDIDVEELIALLRSQAIYGFSEAKGYEFDENGRIVLQCQPSRKLLRDIMTRIKGLKTYPIAISTKITAPGLTDKPVALFSSSHTGVLAVKDRGFLRRPQFESGIFDLTPDLGGEEVNRIESKISDYLNEVVVSAVNTTQSLPTKHIQSKEKKEIEERNTQTELIQMKERAYGIARKDLKMGDDEFKEYVATAHDVANTGSHDSSFEKLIAALELYQAYVEMDEKDPDVLEKVHVFVRSIAQDEEGYLQYLTSPDPRLKPRLKQYFGRYISSSPLVFSTARRLGDILTQEV